MRKNKLRFIVTASLALSLSFGLLTGCSKEQQTAASETSFTHPSVESSTEFPLAADSGTLYLKVNPEIAVQYDKNGVVTSVEGLNADGKSIITRAENYIGQHCRDAVPSLVSEINEAGYFVEETEGEARQIIIEVEKGSVMPDENFLGDIVSDVQNYVNTMQLNSSIQLHGETDYGSQSVNDPDDTDYGPNADGVTDYDDTDYGPNADGVTDYDDTDYGPNADGITDYNDTDYGPNADGVTDYDDTDYGPNADGVTDYDDTDYGPNADGITDYNDDGDDGDDDDDDDDGDDDDDDDDGDDD